MMRCVTFVRGSLEWLWRGVRAGLWSRRKDVRRGWRGLEGIKLVDRSSIERIWCWPRVVVYIPACGSEGAPSHVNKVGGTGKAGTAGRFTVGIATIGKHG
jgi:hypothetical protein